MVETPVQVGASISPQRDVRVTKFGRFLRRTKLNELPQLFNILKGEMTLVGPRPEAPDLAELYPPQARVLFSVKPGLVGPSQILNRNEGELYPEGVELKEYYIQHILPEKLKVDLEYVSRPTLTKDLKYIFLAFKETLFGALSKRHFFENKSQIYLFLLDVALIFGSYLFAIELRFEGMIPDQEWNILLKTFPILLSCRTACFIGFGLYGVLIRYLNFYNYLDLVKAVTISSLMTGSTVYLVGYSSFPRSILIMDWFCMNFFMIFIRVHSKLLRDRLYAKESNGRKKVLIFGAGDKGNLAASQLKDSMSIIGFLDDDLSKRHKRVQHYPVMGGRHDIESLSKIYPIDEIIIAISNLDDRDLNRIISLCHKASLECSIFTTFADSFIDRRREDYLRTQKIAHWAGCQEFQLDLAVLEQKLSHVDMLLIGPSNVLGLELLKYLSSLNTGEILILDRYESYLNETLMRALAVLPRDKVRPLLSKDPLPEAAEKILSGPVPPGIIFHMGTRKYSSYVQPDPIAVAQDNILNTVDLLEVVNSSEVKLFLMTSTIGAARPVNFICATLRLAEHYVQSRAMDSIANSASVRLLNLVENRGSILHRIQSQIMDGKKVILNHPEEERYFFTAPSAAKFILLSTAMALDGKGGSQGIFVPFLNGRARILDIAKLIIEDYGLNPEKDVEIQFVGSENPQEWKEEVALNGQLVQETPHDNIRRIVTPSSFTSGQITEDIEQFRSLVEKKDREGLVRKVNETLKLVLS